MRQNLLMVILSIALLSGGWVDLTGLTLLVSLVPLLLISARAEDSRRGWWSTFAWGLLTFVGWNLATIWWIGKATIMGPIAATLFSSFYSLLAFMIYHTVSKRAPRALGYTLFVALWVALEKYYSVGDFSWPWLLLGNGFSHEVWAVQWYEFTGMFGGTLWVLVCNMLLFDALRDGVVVVRRVVQFVVAIVVPIVLSLVLYVGYDGAGGEQLEVAVVQPNVDNYDRSITSRQVEELILELLGEVPQSADVVVLSETIMPRYYWESALDQSAFVVELRERMSSLGLDAALVVGANTMVPYYSEEHPYTARAMRGREGVYYDVFNSAVVIGGDELQLRHKSKLVIGVECTPEWVLQAFDLCGVDMGQIAVGQIGKGGQGVAFDMDSTRLGVAICYEGLYGEFYGDFVRDGAEAMVIISNDCWWDNTPGYRHLYRFSSLRAIEYRRAIARSANTGISGFIDERGVSIQSMGWGERGVMVGRVSLNKRATFYAENGDFVARLATLVAVLSLLYYVSYRVRKRHYLVD